MAWTEFQCSFRMHDEYYVFLMKNEYSNLNKNLRLRWNYHGMIWPGSPWTVRQILPSWNWIWIHYDKITLSWTFLGFKQESASEIHERTSFGFHTFGYSVIWNNSAGFKCIFWSLLHNIDLEYECHHITFMTSRDKSFSLIF